MRNRKRPAPDRVGTAVAVLDAPAHEVHVGAIGKTVAEDNPGYSADDPVIEVVWASQVDGVAATEWGADGLHAIAHSRLEISIYHFPTSRLVRGDRLRDVPPGDLLLAPYHERAFDGDANRGYINAIRSQGYVESVLVARETDAGLELFEGHTPHPRHGREYRLSLSLRAYLSEHGLTSLRELVADVRPAHPVRPGRAATLAATMSGRSSSGAR